MYNVNLSEIHVEGEVHELFREISNGEDEHGDTNGDRNSTWKMPSFSFCYDNFTIVRPDPPVVANLKIVENRRDVH